jgi:alpha-amylase
VTVPIPGPQQSPFEDPYQHMLEWASFDTPDGARCVRNPRGTVDWRDSVIYFVMTDRFQDLDPCGSADVVKGDLSRFQGGDLRGVIDKLPYLAELGVTDIWITPPLKNQVRFFSADGYHGYWPIEHREVDEHIGNLEDLRTLVVEASLRGMRVILDIPLNHVAWDHPWTKDPTKHDWFHHYGDITDFNDPFQLEHYSLHGLPDLAQENRAVTRELIEICKWWIEQTGARGIRLDAVKHVPRTFWSELQREIGQFAGPDFLLIGEDFTGDIDHVGQYQRDGMGSLFDFPLYFTLRSVFTHDGSMEALAHIVEEGNRRYVRPEYMTAFLDNHDTTRFVTEAGYRGREKLQLALAFLMTANRIPSIYYGTEVGMEGRQESYPSWGPENRGMMEWERDPKLREYLGGLAYLRATTPELRYGTFLEMWRDHFVYGYSRRYGDDETIVVLNNGHAPSHRRISLRSESTMPDGTVLTDLLSGNSCTIQGRALELTIPGKRAVLLVASGRRPILRCAS